jgi:hypothetical protein
MNRGECGRKLLCSIDGTVPVVAWSDGANHDLHACFRFTVPNIVWRATPAAVPVMLVAQVGHRLDINSRDETVR